MSRSPGRRRPPATPRSPDPADRPARASGHRTSRLSFGARLATVTAGMTTLLAVAIVLLVVGRAVPVRAAAAHTRTITRPLTGSSTVLPSSTAPIVSSGIPSPATRHRHRLGGHRLGRHRRLVADAAARRARLHAEARARRRLLHAAAQARLLHRDADGTRPLPQPRLQSPVSRP